MKIFFILSLILTLGGCATVDNPIGNKTLASAISTYGFLDTAVIAYRSLPRCTKTDNFSITNICYKRSVLLQAQAYDKAANVAINNAVEFQRNNPTLNAASYIDAAITSVDVFKNFAHAAQLPGVN